MNELSLHRIYNGAGWQPSDFADDGSELRPDTIIVEPVRPPRQAEGVRIIGAASRTEELLSTVCLVFRVLAVGPQVTQGNLVVMPGDPVALRNAALDPIHPNGNVLRIDPKHIFLRFPRG